MPLAPTRSAESAGRTCPLVARERKAGHPRLSQPVCGQTSVTVGDGVWSPGHAAAPPQPKLGRHMEVIPWTHARPQM